MKKMFKILKTGHPSPQKCIASMAPECLLSFWLTACLSLKSHGQTLGGIMMFISPIVSQVL